VRLYLPFILYYIILSFIINLNQTSFSFHLEKKNMSNKPGTHDALEVKTKTDFICNDYLYFFPDKLLEYYPGLPKDLTNIIVSYVTSGFSEEKKILKKMNPLIDEKDHIETIIQKYHEDKKTLCPRCIFCTHTFFTNYPYRIEYFDRIENDNNTHFCKNRFLRKIFSLTKQKEKCLPVMIAIVTEFYESFSKKHNEHTTIEDILHYILRTFKNNKNLMAYVKKKTRRDAKYIHGSKKFIESTNSLFQLALRVIKEYIESIKKRHS
jgi:hypothetical protein